MSYQVSVMYGGKKLIPAPFVSLRKVYQRSGDGTVRQRVWEITISGQVVAFKGSPDNTGTFWTASGYPPDPSDSSNDPEFRIANIKNKLNAISDLFSVDGMWFEIQPGDGSSTIKFQPRITKINYQEGKWFDTVPFTIEMEADCLFFGDYTDPIHGGVEACGLSQLLNPPEESWSFEPDELGRTYKVSHAVSATAKKRFDESGNVLAEGWEVARDLIIGGPFAGSASVSKLGFHAAEYSAAHTDMVEDINYYNYLRSVQIDEGSGKYSINETWLGFADAARFRILGGSSGVCLEDVTVETRYSSENGLYSTSVNATFTGLEERDSLSRELVKSRYENAKLRWQSTSSFYTYANTHLQYSYPTVTLNPAILSKTVSENVITGVITVNESYDTRYGITSGYLSEVYTASLDHAANIFAKIGVIGRPLGPILQDIGSSTEKSITMSAEIVVPVTYGASLPTSPNYDSLTAALSIIGIPTQIFMASDRETWNARMGRYTRNTVYVYQ